MEHEEQFDALRRALKLKRYEQPPPGHFKFFSTQVISRIRENDVHDRKRAMDAAEWEAPWLTRFLDFFQGRPAYAGALGATACVLLLGAIFYSERPPALATGQGGAQLGTPQDIAGVGLFSTPTETALVGNSDSPIGALQPGTTLFDKMRPLQSTTPVFTKTNLLLK